MQIATRRSMLFAASVAVLGGMAWCVRRPSRPNDDDAAMARVQAARDSSRTVRDAHQVPDSAAAEDSAGEVITPADTGARAADPRAASAIGVWRISGTEPFWGVHIDTGGIVFNAPDLPKGLRFPISVPVYVQSSIRFNSTTERRPAHDIEVELTTGDCSDGMSDKTWPLRARVTLDRRAFMGCGERLDSPNQIKRAEKRP